MSIRKAGKVDICKKNALFYSARTRTFPLSAEWGARFVLRDGRDFAADLMRFAARFSDLTEKEFLCRRLAVHEAVLNALCNGGGKPVLTAWGTGRFMRVGIRQENDIRWPAQSVGYRGTDLIKRYASETTVSSDGKTLILRFY